MHYKIICNAPHKALCLHVIDQHSFTDLELRRVEFLRPTDLVDALFKGIEITLTTNSIYERLCGRLNA